MYAIRSYYAQRVAGTSQGVEVELHGIGFMHHQLVLQAGMFAQPSREIPVQLHHMQLLDTGGHRLGQGTETRAYLYHDVVRPRMNGVITSYSIHYTKLYE